MFRRKTIALSILLLSGVAAHTQSIGDEVRQKLGSSVFLIRNFYEENRLHYDSTGELIGKRTTGAWTLAGFQTKKVSLKNGVLRLEGSRIAKVYDSASGSFFQKRFSGDVRIDIDLPNDVNVDAATKLIDKVLVRESDLAVDMLPTYWLPFLTHEKPGGMNRPGTWFRPNFPRVGKGIRAPRPIYDPDPGYPEVARAAGLQGTVLLWVVIGTTGAVQDIAIVRPLGAGLDEKAVECVRQWRFQPATRDGNPVPVQVNVEINFHIY